MSSNNSFFKEANNCWRVSEVDQGAAILSGQDYFRAFRQAILQAERSVYILAWDISAVIKTSRDEEYDDGHPAELSAFIFSVLEAKPDLEIYILLWDYSMVYIAEREWLPFSEWQKEGQPRLHFEVDNAISTGASHHQKVVIVDEAFAFCGGFDLSAWRWDTREHLAKDPRRETPKGELYQPYHDIQLALTGAVTKDFSDLFAMRWERATGESLARQEAAVESIPWPESLSVDFENETMALALTFSKFKDYEASFHIEQLHLDMIARAKQYIYIENQYLSSHTIVNALANRLRESEGPEVIVVLTKDTGGFLEEGTLGVLRDRLLEILDQADTHGRLCAQYPYVCDDEGNESQVYVHAKLLIADDSMLEIGSANLSNRSMKVDSEVDMAIVRDEPSPFIQQLLRRLLAIHFKCSIEDVEAALASEGAICPAIAKLREGHPHALRPLSVGNNSYLLRKIADTQLLDPSEPISPAYWMREAFAEDTDEAKQSSPWRKYAKVGAWILLGCICAYGLKELWGGLLSKDAVIGWLEGFRSHPLLIPILLGIFILAGMIALPINLLLVGGTIALGPWVTFGCGLVGALASAALAFWMGHQFGKPLLEKVAKDKLRKLSKQVGKRGVLSVAVIRVVPIAPFVVINLVAGFSSLKFRTFMSGSALGMFPGMLGVVLVTNQVQSVLSDPSWKTWFMLAGVVLVFGALTFFIRKQFSQ